MGAKTVYKLYQWLVETNNRNNSVSSMSIYSEQQGEIASTSDLERGEAASTVIKIANFLEMKNIFISQFWQSNRNYASPQDLEKFCEANGLKLGIHDQINLKNELFSKKEVISIYEFCEKIPHWKAKSSEMISRFLKERSQLLVNNLNSKHKNQRIKSQSNHYIRPATSNPVDYKKPRMFSATKQAGRSFKPNNSRKYLEENKLKALKREQELTETIEKTKNEHEYSILMKMNELNEYNHKNKSSITYRAFKNAEGVIKVREFDLENPRKELSIQQFESEYKVFKKSTKENKHWERPALAKTQSQMDLAANTGGLSKNQKKEERQQELKNLLANTVSLTKMLQDQIRIFKMKGIYGCENV